MKQFLTLLFVSIYTLSIAQHWNVTELNPMPEAISNNAVCEGFVDETPYVYSFGGIDESKEYSGIHLRSYRFNTETTLWESIPPLPDTLGKIAASANRIGDIIYIIGGYHVFENGSEVSSNRVHRYNTQTNTYLSDGAEIPVPIDDQVQVVFRDSLIYVITGWSNNGNVNNVQIYDPANDQWQIGTPIGGTEIPSFGAAGTIIGDTIYFFGGARNINFAIQSILRKGAINPDNPLEIEWSKKSIAIPTYRPAVTSAKNNAYILGGAGQTYNFDGLAYSNNLGVSPSNRSVVYRPTDEFKESDLSNMLPMDLRGVANVSDTVKYLAGGMIEDQTVTDKIWKLELIDLPTSNKYIEVDPNLLEIFPNPTTSFLKIEFSESLFFDIQQSNIQITNQLGQVVLIEHSLLNKQLNIHNLKPGIYNLTISDARYRLNKTFIKM